MQWKNIVKTTKRAGALLAAIVVGGTAIAGVYLANNHAKAATDDWPTSLHDLARTAASNDTGISLANAPLLKQAWTYSTGGVIATSPSISNGIAYFGSWDGYEYAVNASTGALVWKTYLGVTNYNPVCVPASAGISSPATIQNGIVYVGGGDSYWYALDAASGAVQWKIRTGDSSAAGGNYNWSAPLIYNGYAYIGVASLGDCPLVQGKLLKVNLASHQLENTLNLVPNGQVGGGIWTSPALDTATGRIFSATGTKNDPTQHMAQAFVAIDSGTMRILDHWELPNSEAVLDSDFGTSTTLFTDAQGRKLITAINKNGKAYTFDRNNLNAGPVWEQYIAGGGDCPTCGEASVSSGAFGGGRLYLAGGNGKIGNQGFTGTVDALDPATGQYLWQHPTSGVVIGALAYANGLVYVSGGNVFEALDAATGRTVFSYDLGASTFAGPSIANGFVYASNVYGKMFAFNVGSAITPPADANCPSGWSCQDVGNVASAGSETVSGSTWTAKASGGGLAGTADSFRLMTKPTTADGNVQITGQVTSQQNAGANSQTGLILRQSNKPGAPFYSVMVKPNNTLVVQQRRNQDGGVASLVTSTTLGSLPKYLMIQRQGNSLVAATSTNGTSYTLVPGSTTTQVLPVTSLAGIAASSGANGAASQSVISNPLVGAPTITPVPASDGSACPSGWTCQDVGNPNIVGGQTVSGSTWNLKGAGGDIWGTQDQFHYGYRSLAADGTVSANVTALPTSDTYAKTGVMIRSSASADAAYYAAYLQPDHSIHVQMRSVSGWAAEELTSQAGGFPQYLRVARSGSTFTTYTSTDGTTWTALEGSTEDIDAMGSGSVLAGVALTSHNSTTLGTATLSNVSVATGAPAPPNLCPSGWDCQDIGFPTPSGDQTNTGGSWKIGSGGGDIWGTYDTYRMVSQNRTGDSTVSAQISSQSNTGEWAKAGPMFRASNSPQAPYFAAFVTPAHGVVVQWRSVQGGQTSQVSTAGSAPLYLRVARTSDNFVAYTSSDGATWTAVAGSNQTLPNLAGTSLAGMAADSYNTVTENTTVWNNVTITGGNTSSGLPIPWQHSDIGGASPAGSASYANNTYTINGGGNDIWGSDDQSQYAYQNITGDGSLVARVTSQTNTDGWAKAGIMFKASPTAGSNYAAAMVTPANGIHFQYNFSGDQSGGSYSLPNTWLKLTRDGSLFTAYKSTDGTNWIAIGRTTINMPLNATIGLFVNAHNGSTSTGSAVFDNVSFTPTGGGALPAGWQSADIGSPGLPGSSSYANGVYTVKGSGSDIWGSDDQLQLAYQTLPTQATIIARVTNLDNTDPWAKAGLLVKASTTAGSPYAMVAATAGNDLHMQSNFNSDIGGGSYNFPNAWLKLVRNGNSVTTYKSADGTNWTQIGTATVALPANALVGLFVNAHASNTALASAQFDNVSVTTP